MRWISVTWKLIKNRAPYFFKFLYELSRVSLKNHKFCLLSREYPFWDKNAVFWRTHLPGSYTWYFHTMCCISFKRTANFRQFEPTHNTFGAFMIEIYSNLCKCTENFVSNEARSHDVKHKVWIPSFLVKLSNLKDCLLVITPKLKMCDWRTDWHCAFSWVIG